MSLYAGSPEKKQVIGGEGRVWEGVVQTFWLFNGHGSTEVSGAMIAYIGPATAGQLWKLWQLTWSMIAYIVHPTAAELWQL